MDMDREKPQVDRNGDLALDARRDWHRHLLVRRGKYRQRNGDLHEQRCRHDDEIDLALQRADDRQHGIDRKILVGCLAFDHRVAREGAFEDTSTTTEIDAESGPALSYFSNPTRKPTPISVTGLNTPSVTPLDDFGTVGSPLAVVPDSRP